MAILRRAGALVRAIWVVVHEERLTFMAGSIAFHAFVSLLPFLLVVVLLVAAVEDQATAMDVLVAMGAYLSPHAHELVVQTVTQATRETSLSIIGIGVLFWATIKIFRCLDEAFSSIYDQKRTKSLIDAAADALIALVAVCLGIAVAGVVITVFTFDDGVVGTALGELLSVVTLSIVFLPLYYLLPDERVTVREVLPGTVFAAVGWTILGYLFRFYVAFGGIGERYGILGTVLLLVMWLYFAGLVLLLGAAINAVLAGRSANAAELGWGADRDARADATFVEALETIDSAFTTGQAVRVRIGDDEVTLPPPDEHDLDVSAPDQPDALGGEEVEGRLDLRWVDGRAVEEGEE